MANEIKRKLDSRTYDRYLKNGSISQKDYEGYLKALPDDEANATWVQMDLHETEISSDEDDDEDDDSSDEAN